MLSPLMDDNNHNDKPARLDSDENADGQDHNQTGLLIKTKPKTKKHWLMLEKI